MQQVFGTGKIDYISKKVNALQCNIGTVFC